MPTVDIYRLLMKVRVLGRGDLCFHFHCLLHKFSSAHHHFQGVYIIFQNILQVTVHVVFCDVLLCFVMFLLICLFVFLINSISSILAKGRTNYELHPESYALRDGVAQTMTLFKPRLVTVHRPTCLYHQQQLAAAAAAAAASTTAKSSPATTPLRVRNAFLKLSFFKLILFPCSH